MSPPKLKLTVKDLTVHYGPKKALGPVSMDVIDKSVTALILSLIHI